MDMKKFDEAAYYILKRIQLNGQLGTFVELGQTLDVLERIIEVLRFKYKCRENNLEFENFIQGKILVRDDVLNYYAPAKYYDLGSGTAPIRLQPNLLVFLLLYHRQSIRVYDIIDNFIERIWDNLSPVDFKKTRTGVTRCFTNTRFAANTLRGYGFLKFTHKEAYKTWVLSLPGFLVASKLLENNNWSIPEFQDSSKIGLHSDLLTAWDGLQTYDEFVGRLGKVCKPNVKVFVTFEGVLKKAHVLLTKYWAIIKNQELTKTQRKQASLKLLAELEDNPQIEDFYKEFSMCLNVDMLIKSVDNPQ